MPRFAMLLAVLVPCLGAPASAQVTLKRLGTYATGLYEQVAAEIGAHDPATQRVFVTNAATNTVDVINMQDPRSLSLAFAIPLGDYGASPTSVAFKNGLGAVAVISDPKTDPGRVVFFTSAGAVLGSVVVGSLPDSVAFSPDGKKLVVANEGEPSEDYTVDPEGSISIIDVAAGGTQANVRTVGFTSLNDQKSQLQARGIRIYGPRIELAPGENGTPEPVVTQGGATVAQDFEPEFIAISKDSKTAWVTLQENNAVAIIDIQRARLRKVVPLGYKLHALRRNALDASDRDGGMHLKNWPTRGMYLPDGVAYFEVEGQSYIITANEGDTRDWEGFSEEERVGGLTLGGPLSLVPDLQKNENLGRLKVTNSPPGGKDAGAGPDGEDVYRRLYSFGGRSFSIWNDQGELVFDSGDDLERQTAKLLGANFNSDNASGPSPDSRSDDKGPEPEGVAVGKVNGKTYAFICLERPGGVAIYDISHPRSPRFADYVNNRDFTVKFNLEDCAGCEETCTDDCVQECSDCKSACATCADCPEGDDCAEECALCEECTPKFSECAECDPACPAVAACGKTCTESCVAENCPQPGVAGRDPLDLGPEGVVFIPADASPRGFGPLLLVTNEVSGSTTVFEVVPRR